MQKSTTASIDYERGRLSLSESQLSCESQSPETYLPALLPRQSFTAREKICFHVVNTTIWKTSSLYMLPQLTAGYPYLYLHMHLYLSIFPYVTYVYLSV